MKIAFITYNGQVKYSAANGFDEIQDLLPFLQGKGLDIRAEIWDDPAVDWSKYEVALLRMPWDYTEKLAAFREWLDKIEDLGIRLLNDYETVRWNIDKRYLGEIAAAGFDVIPSVFLNEDWDGNAAGLFEALQCTELILKPCVSAGSRNTIRLTRSDLEQSDNHPYTLPTSEPYIAQPFMAEINAGEWSFTFFNGQHSHTVLKKPQQGDFRVQQFFGGTIELIYPDQGQIDKAASYLAAFAPQALYARVDGVMVDGSFVLMELELIEPFLYLAYDPASAERYYEAISAQLTKFADNCETV